MPPATTPIKITADPVVALPVELVGIVYEVTPPKSSLAMKLAVRAKTSGDDPSLMVDTLYEWVDSAFGDEAPAVRARLEDPKDLLDIIHISKLMEVIVKETTGGNPTS